MNKFSALARDQYLGFIVGQNILMLVAYAILGVIGTFLAQPIVTLWTCKSSRRGGLAIFLRSMAVVFVIHGFCTLRLVKTRPYFLNEAELGQWYYKVLDFPESLKPTALFVLFTLLPLLFIGFVVVWPWPPGVVGGGRDHAGCRFGGGLSILVGSDTGHYPVI